MTDNLYAPPEADLTKPNDQRTPYDGRFDRPMVLATILSIIVSIGTVVLFYLFDSESFVLLHELVSFVFTITLSVFVVYFIKRMRVEGLGSSSENAAEPLGIWGYFWRIFVVESCAIILLMVPMVLFLAVGIDLTSFFESFLGVFVVNIALFPIALFCTWAFFSKDRSGQLSGLFSIVRGA